MTSIVVFQSLALASCSSLMAPSSMPQSFKSGTFLAPGPSSAVSSRSVESKSRLLLDTRMPVSPSREEKHDAVERRFYIHVGGIPNYTHQSPFFFSFFPTLPPLAGKAWLGWSGLQPSGEEGAWVFILCLHQDELGPLPTKCPGKEAWRLSELVRRRDVLKGWARDRQIQNPSCLDKLARASSDTHFQGNQDEGPLAPNCSQANSPWEIPESHPTPWVWETFHGGALLGPSPLGEILPAARSHRQRERRSVLSTRHRMDEIIINSQIATR